LLARTLLVAITDSFSVNHTFFVVATMLLRRLYSSLPQRAASAPSTTVAHGAKAAGSRGRTRPVRIKVARVKPAAPESSVATSQTHGRRLRRALVGRPVEDFYSSEIPKAAVAATGFQPITLYPFHAGLHLSFTPPHMPLPLNLGHRGYFSKEEEHQSPLFQRSSAPSPLAGLDLAKTPSSFSEHMKLTEALSHPSLTHHLGSGRPTSFLRTINVDADNRLEAILESAATAHADAAEDAWNAALQRLGAKPSQAETAISAAEQASIDDAIAGLNGLLARLEATEVEDEFVNMDSVKRKRKKKMNKHKYKKRRKVSFRMSWVAIEEQAWHAQ